MTAVLHLVCDPMVTCESLMIAKLTCATAGYR